MVEGGTVVVIQGPRFSTRAESRWFAAARLRRGQHDPVPRVLARPRAGALLRERLARDRLRRRAWRACRTWSRCPPTRRSACSPRTSIDCARFCSGRCRESARSRTTSAPRRWTARSSTTSGRRALALLTQDRRTYPLEFLTDWGVVIALVCAGAAVVYGVVTSRWLLALSPGNEEMQAISAAVQEGAKAYLRRQYTIIAGVAVVLAIVLGGRARGPGRRGHPGRDRLPDRRHLLRRGRLHRHERVGARERPRGRVGALGRVARRSRWPSRAAPSPACSWPGLALLGVAGYYGILILAGTDERDAIDALVGPRLRRLADLGLRPSGRRHLHQGRRRGRRPRRQDRGRASPRTTRATRR